MPQTFLYFFMLFSGVIAGGTVFFRMVEGWRWVDAYYFTFATVSTVGYGDFVPGTDAGKIGATILVVIGFAVFAAMIQRVGRRFLLPGSEKDRPPRV